MRHNGLDFGRVLAALGVVFIHVGWNGRQLGGFICLASRFAVPFFVMLMGYTLYPVIQAGDYGATVIRRIRKLLRVFLVASILFLPLGLAGEGWSYFNLQRLLSGGYYHLWFFVSTIFALALTRLFNPLRRIYWSISWG